MEPKPVSRQERRPKYFTYSYRDRQVRVLDSSSHLAPIRTNSTKWYDSTHLIPILTGLDRRFVKDKRYRRCHNSSYEWWKCHWDKHKIIIHHPYTPSSIQLSRIWNYITASPPHALLHFAPFCMCVRTWARAHLRIHPQEKRTISRRW